MKIHKQIFFIGLALLLSCKKDDDNKTIVGCMDPKSLNYNPQASVNSNDCIYPIELTQEQLDAVTKPHLIGVTGPHTNLSAGIRIHDPEIGDSTIRDIFCNIKLANKEPLPPGTVIVRKVFRKLPNGQRGEIQEITVMHKQPKGYNPSAYDLEFVLFDEEENITEEHPNGYLKKVTQENRGKVRDCMRCHSLKENKDGLFTNF